MTPELFARKGKRKGEKEYNRKTSIRQEKLASHKKVFDCVKDSTDLDRVKFGLKINKIKESGTHLDSYQLCV